MKSKRGQGLPMNTIVIAAIVLIVLVVLIMIFTGGMGDWLKKLKGIQEPQECDYYKNAEGIEAKWMEGLTCPTTHTQIYSKLKNVDQHPGQVCCLPRVSTE